MKEENNEDPDDAWDPTGYYRRKAARQDEEIKGCLWVVLLAVLMGLAIGAYELITGEEVFTRNPDDIDRALLITTPPGD